MYKFVDEIRTNEHNMYTNPPGEDVHVCWFDQNHQVDNQSGRKLPRHTRLYDQCESGNVGMEIKCVCSELLTLTLELAPPQQTRHIVPMLDLCYASVADGVQHWYNVCLLERFSHNSNVLISILLL